MCGRSLLAAFQSTIPSKPIDPKGEGSYLSVQVFGFNVMLEECVTFRVRSPQYQYSTFLFARVQLCTGPQKDVTPSVTKISKIFVHAARSRHMPRTGSSLSRLKRKEVIPSLHRTEQCRNNKRTAFTRSFLLSSHGYSRHEQQYSDDHDDCEYSLPLWRSPWLVSHMLFFLLRILPALYLIRCRAILLDDWLWWLNQLIRLPSVV